MVRFYDEKLQEFKKTSLVVQWHKSDISDISDGQDKVVLKNGTCLVYDATNIRSEDVGRSYPWYVMSSALKKAGIAMNSLWNPAFAYIYKGMIVVENFASDTNIIVVPDKSTCIQMKNVEASTIMKRDDNGTLTSLGGLNPSQFLVLPLKETITHIYPIHSGLTLLRMAICIRKGYEEEWMDNPVKVMNFLFSNFVSKFNELSRMEACPITELYNCLFANTFRVSLDRLPISDIYTGVSFYATREDERVIITTKSSLFTHEDYGDIAWFLMTDKDREGVSGADKVKHWNGKFVILPENPRIIIRGESILFERLIIFPQIEIDRVTHEYGSMIGMLTNGQLDYRGSLFDDISEREEEIIRCLFNEFVNGALTNNYNPIEGLKTSRIRGRCRVQLIDKIKKILITHLASRSRSKAVIKAG